MADYIELPLVADPDALTEIGVEYMEGSIDGFELRPGNVETVLLESSSQIGAEIIDQVSLVAPSIFAYIGQSLYGISIQGSVPATATATVTFAADVPAVMLPAGSLISAPSPAGSPVAFATDDDLVAPALGGTLTVGVTALEGGSTGNGAFGLSELIDVIDGVTSIAVDGSIGGVDAESADEYLDRLADGLTLLAPRPILPNDFAAFARQVPGVGRAMSIDLYQPGTVDNVGGLHVEGAPVLVGAGATPVARCVSTSVTGEGGAAPSQDLLHDVWLALDSAREVNFLAYVIPPSYTTVSVQATVTAYPGYLPADVKSTVEGMLATWLDPDNFGSPPSSTGPQWAGDTVARLYEAVDWINRAAGVFYVSDVKLRTSDVDPWVAADVPLAGKAALPLPGTFDITVVAAA
jgi:hypothetical protein